VNAGDASQYPAVQATGAEPLRDALPHPHPSWLQAERSSPEQVALMQAMTGQQRLKVAEQMFWMARKLKAAGVRCQHPAWTETEVLAEVNRIFLHAGE
jgi:hypothetical protein